MRIYKTLRDLDERKQMSLWHRAHRITWSPTDVDGIEMPQADGE